VLTFEELRAEVEEGFLDTVVVAFTDMQGRLMGKRLHAEFFCDEIGAGHEVEGCNYLLALDMEMDPIPGYEIASWERGYGDFAMKPDISTLRRIPWLEATALVLADVLWHDGSPVQPSPRQVLKAQMDRAAALGFTPMTGSELEFYLLRETYQEAWAQRYEELTPSVPYILDYHILATTYDEDLIRQIRNGMHAAGIKVETSKGEAWPGQHEINFRFADALTMADNHVIYKNGAKEIAFLHGCAISFMAKPFESWIGNSCHIHASLWRDGRNAFARGDSPTTLFRRFLAGQIACAKELAVFFAPTINSYKRYAAGSWAPTTLAWGHDNRTCGFRVVGHGQALRVETRIPGGDVNPYLAFAAMIASGLHGIEQGLRLPAALEGNAYESRADRFPSTMREAIDALERGTVARAAFGDQVVDHYLNYARTEQGLFDRHVTDWERKRYFERT
jgi:glutamine synthetase